MIWICELWVQNCEIDENVGPMDWKTRHKIAVGTARGLHYLHKGCQRRIIHRDIKASNILLTADFEPQVHFFLSISSAFHVCSFIKVSLLFLAVADIWFWISQMASLSVDSSFNCPHRRHFWVSISHTSIIRKNKVNYLFNRSNIIIILN